MTLYLVPNKLGTFALLLQLWAESFHTVPEELAVTPHTQNLLVLQTRTCSLLLRTHWAKKGNLGVNTDSYTEYRYNDQLHINVAILTIYYCWRVFTHTYHCLPAAASPEVSGLSSSSTACPWSAGTWCHLWKAGQETQWKIKIKI